MRIKRMLAPTDLSPLSLEAVDYATRLAWGLKAELVILLVDESIYALPGPAFDAHAAVQAMEIARQAMERELEQRVDRLRKSGLKTHGVFVPGRAAQRIVETAEKLRVDWIVMATHGRTGLKHALLGSVAERVVRHASCPVLTVPSRRPPAKRPRR